MPTRSWIAKVPRGAKPPFRVFVNGVEQSEGEDYRVQEGSLVFSKPLAKEGKLGAVRWASMFLGIAGTYRKNDSIDVVYSVGGRRVVASGLEILPPASLDVLASP